MGATASVQLLSWQQLADLAEAARQPPVVAATVRRYKLDAATALEMEERDVAKLKPRLKPLEKLKVVAALGQIKSFAHRADKARARLAQLAKDQFGGVRQMFECLDLWDVLDDATVGSTTLSRSKTGRRPRREMSLALFSRALKRHKLHGLFPYDEQEMIFRAIHADATEMMFFSQTVGVKELMEWLEATPLRAPTADPNYVPRSYVSPGYVQPPELKTVTVEAPRVESGNISRVKKPLSAGGFGTVVSATTWKQSWRQETISSAPPRPQAKRRTSRPPSSLRSRSGRIRSSCKCTAL